MSEGTLKCPKCSGGMKEGSVHQADTWTEMKTTKVLGMTARTPQGPQYTVVSFRCEQCGFIELYGVPPNQIR